MMIIIRNLAGEVVHTMTLECGCHQAVVKEIIDTGVYKVEVIHGSK